MAAPAVLRRLQRLSAAERLEARLSGAVRKEPGRGEARQSEKKLHSPHCPLRCSYACPGRTPMTSERPESPFPSRSATTVPEQNGGTESQARSFSSPRVSFQNSESFHRVSSPFLRPTAARRGAGTVSGSPVCGGIASYPGPSGLGGAVTWLPWQRGPPCLHGAEAGGGAAAGDGWRPADAARPPLGLAGGEGAAAGLGVCLPFFSQMRGGSFLSIYSFIFSFVRLLFAPFPL